eukprot:COSAG02_NODE_1714_length_11220_cov_3.198543_5_plen_112_part_00
MTAIVVGVIVAAVVVIALLVSKTRRATVGIDENAPTVTSTNPVAMGAISTAPAQPITSPVAVVPSVSAPPPDTSLQSGTVTLDDFLTRASLMEFKGAFVYATHCLCDCACS